MNLTTLDHPLAAHLMAGLRDEATEPAVFRRLSRTLATLLVLEATKGIQTKRVAVQTPLASVEQSRLGQGLAVVPILRAGLGLLEAALDMFPDVAVGYVGLERDHESAVASSYYCKLPSLAGKLTLCCDPMLATGGSASQALTILKKNGATDLVMVCVVAAPEGVAVLQANHPDVPIIAAALDVCLNDHKYIVPGLGDYGDRLFGTL
ncbi:MAG: uracil phosphoribosyltransferase [Armatimonadetes bacterium]|nr:uracil phosphoribosyltransferase [Armatimonadota bacterium]